jgi:hypothetical protein
LRGLAFSLSDYVGFHVDGWRLEPRGRGTGGAAGRFFGALAVEHALQERGGLDQLARASQASGFANYVMIEQLITSFCRRERL